MKTLISIIIFSLSFQAFGAVQNLEIVGGASRIEGNPISAVWGVLAGPPNMSATSQYNNCPLSGQDDTFSGCHEQRVNSTQVITVQFVETEAVVSAAPIAIIKGVITGDTNNNISVARNAGGIRSGTNQPGIVTFTWGDLCRLIKNGAGTNATVVTDPENGKDRCELDGAAVSGSFIITFGFETSAGTPDTSSTTSLPFYLHSPTDETHLTTPECTGTYGFCDIAVFPGDSGGTLAAVEGFERTTKLSSGTSAPTPAFDAFGASTTLPLNIESLRLYFSTIDFVSAHPAANSDNFRDLPLDVANSNGETVVFSDPDFTGLENNVPYIFRGATVDTSGYISHLMRRTDEMGMTGFYCPDPNNTTPAACPDYSITPSEVAGLITDSSCFITSATYGSPQAHQVTTFRQFRSKYMWPNKPGRFISRKYNRYGPIGAKWVYQNPSSKKYVRIVLMPFYGFAYLSVHLGFAFALMTYLLGLVVISIGFNKVFDKGKIS